MPNAWHYNLQRIRRSQGTGDWRSDPCPECIAPRHTEREHVLMDYPPMRTVYKRIPNTLYRGITLPEEIEPGTPAKHVLHRLTQRYGGLGPHYSMNEEQARYFADLQAGYNVDTSQPYSPLVVLIRKPLLQHLEDDPQELYDMRVHPWGASEEDEVTIQRGAPVTAIGLQQLLPDTNEWLSTLWRKGYPTVASI